MDSIGAVHISCMTATADGPGSIDEAGYWMTTIFNFNEDGSNLARLPSCCAGLIERYPLNSFAIQPR